MKVSTHRVVLATAFVTVFAASLIALPASALADPTSADVQAQADAAAQKLYDYSMELNDATNNYYAALDAHDTAVQAMNDAQGRIDAAESEEATLQDHLGTRAVAMYKDGNVTFIDVLLGASSFEEFASNWDFLQNMNKSDADSISQLKQVRDEAQAARDDYAQQEQTAADKLTEAENIKAEAEATQAQYQAEYNSLSDEAAALAQQEKEAIAAQNNGADQIQLAGGDNSGSDSDSGGGNTYTGAIPAYDGTRGSAIVIAAYSQLGLPYSWGACSPGVAFDCSGLTMYCYSTVGISLGHNDGWQLAAGTAIPLSEAQPGDILWMSGHVGIYIGGGQYIHAPGDGIPVCIGDNMGMWACAVRI